MRKKVFALTVFGLVACTPQIESVRGPDGQQWMMCESGPDRLCIAAMGQKCPRGYALSNMDKMFTCKPVEGTCATDEELARINTSPETPGQEEPPPSLDTVRGPPETPGQEAPPPSLDAVRGPDCRMWIMCKSGWGQPTGDYNRNRCFKALGEACPHGYDHSLVLDEDMYQCKQQPKANDGNDAGAPEGGKIEPAGRN